MKEDDIAKHKVSDKRLKDFQYKEEYLLKKRYE
jgi:hypothetical protein